MVIVKIVACNICFRRKRCGTLNIKHPHFVSFPFKSSFWVFLWFIILLTQNVCSNMQYSRRRDVRTVWLFADVCCVESWLRFNFNCLANFHPQVKMLNGLSRNQFILIVFKFLASVSATTNVI